MVKKIIFLIFISLLFISPIYPFDDTKDSVWNTGKDDLRHLKAKNSDYQKGKNALKQAEKLYKKGKVKKSKKGLMTQSIFLLLQIKNIPRLLIY